MIKKIAIAALAILATAGISYAECQPVNAAGTVGYVNVRQKPELNSRVITRWSNPENGSDWGSGQYCGEEYVDFDGRTWSRIYLYFKNGDQANGWVSDRVLQFLP